MSISPFVKYPLSGDSLAEGSEFSGIIAADASPTTKYFLYDLFQPYVVMPPMVEKLLHFTIGPVYAVRLKYGLCL